MIFVIVVMVDFVELNGVKLVYCIYGLEDVLLMIIFYGGCGFGM